MSGISPPSSPSSFKSAYSALPDAPDKLYNSPNNGKKVVADVPSTSRKSCEGSTFSPMPPEIAQGKKWQVYALEERAEGSGSGLGSAGGEEEAALMKALLVARICKVEMQIGAPALVNGLPLLGVLQREGIAVLLTCCQDTSERPKVHLARPVDRADFDEIAVAMKPAVDNAAIPTAPPPASILAAVTLAAPGTPGPPAPALAAPGNPAPGTSDSDETGLPSLADLAEYRNYDGDFAQLTDGEFERELELAKKPAMMYGMVKHKQDLETEKERAMADVRMKREARWNANWDEQAAIGKEKAEQLAKEKLADQDALEGKDKKKHDFKKLFGKVGTKIAKVGLKIGEGLMEHAIEGAIEGGAGF
ncbi:hypothetical protein CALCODRAFT_510394 [Calocera cornea HHB12733]|uniref:Uncharacterized protein n=1 Tax=Calocera cornea HHB12733 TaxID=1353952 RepID=A0A165EJ16_9BASI|nr:hypothetical protein CALCODRAFT_510394 [Calocera cornea HHB12733]